MPTTKPKSPRTGNYQAETEDDRDSLTAKVMSKSRRCAARTATGKPCSMAPLADSDRCFNHAPEAAPKRAKARKRGGQRTAAPILFPLPKAAVQLRDVASIQAVLEQVVHETRAQRNCSHRSR